MAKSTSQYVGEVLAAAVRWSAAADTWQAELGKDSFPADYLVKINQSFRTGKALFDEALAIADALLPPLRVETRRPDLDEADLQAVQLALAAVTDAALAAIPTNAEGAPDYQAFDAEGRVASRPAGKADAAALVSALAGLRPALARFMPEALPQRAAG